MRVLLSLLPMPFLGAAPSPAAAAPAPHPPSYVREVHPILSKAGCTQGICHGNAHGKGGLKLSLRGQDPAADYPALVYAGGGRRVNRADPGRSLVLAKPSGALPHMGGTRFTPGSLEYRLLAA